MACGALHASSYFTWRSSRVQLPLKQFFKLSTLKHLCQASEQRRECMEEMKGEEHLCAKATAILKKIILSRFSQRELTSPSSILTCVGDI